MENEATLTIKFCNYYNRPVFDKFILNGEEFGIEKGEIIKKFKFNKYEQDLDKKLCTYELITKKKGDVYRGYFEISSGNHIGYCFLDDPGMTFKILFLQTKEKMKEFIKSKYTAVINNISSDDKEFELSLNQNDTEDRASLILINCSFFTQIKKDGKLLIDLQDVIDKIENYKYYNGYQICYHYDNFQDFAYQKMEEINQLNFDKLYDEYHEDVDRMYDIFIKILESKEKNETKNLIKNFKDIFDSKNYYLEQIIKKKYVYSKKILEADLNEECYFDFIFKIISFFLFGENISNQENYGIDGLRNIHTKFLENKNILEKDELLKIYEKIFLLIDIYTSELLYKDDYIIHYIHIKNIEKDSPLFFAYEFLYNFINDLSYDSIFYYPLLSIDGGFYKYHYKKISGDEYISTYGFNMLSLDKIKDHLKNLIPEVVILSKYINNENAQTNPLNGNVFLNINQFEDINIDKNELEVFSSKHHAFIISKILIHELFGHKKSSFSKEGKNDNSIISFRNELGELKIIDSNDENNNIFKNTKEMFDENKPKILKGDSGYFIEYFLGKINGEYTIAVIDTIQNETNLSKLLDSKLWHRDISTFKEYLKLKSICLSLFDKENIDNDEKINEDIKIMKKKINEANIENEDKKSSEQIQDKNEIEENEEKINRINIENEDKKSSEKIKAKNGIEENEEKINRLFNDIWKKRKDIIIKKKEVFSEKKDEEKEDINNFRKAFFAEFTNGFYRK